MTVYRFPVESIVQFDGNEVTDHNRSELSVSTEKIMNEKRMINGTLRRYVVAEKRTWTLSWENLFAEDDAVVDGFWSGKSIREFYLQTPGEFMLTVTAGDGDSERVLVMFDSFDYDIVKRTKNHTGDWWNVSISLVEV